MPGPVAGWLLAFAVAIGLIVWGAEAFAEHLGAAAACLRVSGFALALLLAGAEPEELATVVAASLKHAPGVAFGDVIGANAAMCLVALAIGALIAPLPFRGSVRRYALLGLPVGAVAVWIAWDGIVSRTEGAVLVGLYLLYVAVIWFAERRPPALGEIGEAMQAHPGKPSRVGLDLVLLLAGVAAMALGGWLLVEAVARLTWSQASELRLGLTLVGFATVFELVALAWSTARRGTPEAAIAGIVGSFAYNATMTLGAGALVRPLVISNATLLRAPSVAMMAALALPIVLAAPSGRLSCRAGFILLGDYAGFVALSLSI